MNDHQNDSDLVRAARKGSLSAFETLVGRHERRIYGLARRITGSEFDAQDVTQQTFLDAVKNLAGFRGSSSFSTWLTTIAANASMKNWQNIFRGSAREGLPRREHSLLGQ